ncbi:MAG: hypothetical protein GX639_16440 [Fibrobacter sp.]|nr:hypothetical protein [Fibrobacter sp.]
MLHKLFFSLLFGVCVLLQAQTTELQPDSSETVPVQEATAPDTMPASVLSVADTTVQPADSIPLPSTASLVIDTIKSPTLAVSKKNYNHREQIVFASFMMVFIAVVIASAQNWNPD